MEKKKILTILVSGLTLYLISTGVSFASFSWLKGREGQGTASPLPGQKESGFNVDLSAPKTEVCPINGAKFTKEEKNIWEKRRPLTVMIENHLDSRPPSGLSRADVVYEAVAEGGITRFLGVFYCGVSAKNVNIAPVRSARIYFIHWAQEYGDRPLFMHVGGANNFCPDCPGGVKMPGHVSSKVRAIEYLAGIGWRIGRGNDFDTTFDSGFPVMWRNYDRLDHVVATEHTVMASTDEAFKQAEKRDLAFNDEKGNPWNKNFVAWKFADDNPVKEEIISSVKFEFWANAPKYEVDWQYDQTNNTYLRFNGGEAHTDLEENNLQLAAKNVVVMIVEEEDIIDKEGHTFIETIGGGKAVVFQNGKAIKGTWRKEKAETRTKFFDENGKEINFVRGTIWIEAVPNYSKVEY